VACNDPYENPAGLKFVTRVELDTRDDLWPDNLAYLEDRLIMNIPNGAGPGTVLLQTTNAYVDWRIVGTKNLVRSTQRAYTGVSSWEEVFVEDGCFIYGRAQGIASTLFNVDGLVTNQLGGAASLRALWFPNSANVPTFDRLSVVSGPITPATANGFPFRSLSGTGAGSLITLAPPGLCRYFQISSDGTFDYDVTQEGNVIWSITTGVTGFSYGFCPAWAQVQITNTSGGTANVAVCWNRFPMTGG